MLPKSIFSRKGTKYPGINYAGSSQSNRDDNGIAYGVISTHSLPGWWYDESEPVYPDTSDCDCITDELGFSHSACEMCDSNLRGDRYAVAKIYPGTTTPHDDYSVCMDCRMYVAYGDIPDDNDDWNQESADKTMTDAGGDFVSSKDPNGECNCEVEPECYTYESEGVVLQSTRDQTEVWVFKSPVTTKTQYCSPCFPGAGNLDTPCKDGVDTYAIPLDWFDEDRPAPYDVTRTLAYLEITS